MRKTLNEVVDKDCLEFKYSVCCGLYYIDFDLDSTRIQADALDHTSTPF